MKVTIEKVKLDSCGFGYKVDNMLWAELNDALKYVAKVVCLDLDPGLFSGTEDSEIVKLEKRVAKLEKRLEGWVGL